MQPNEQQPRVLIQHVVIATCLVCMISEELLLSATRHHGVVYPRQLGMALAKALTDRSLPEIGRRFGNKDHTTVLHAIRRINDLLQGHRGTQELYAAIEAVACSLACVRVGEARATLQPAPEPRAYLPQEAPLRSTHRPPPVPVVEGALTEAQRKEMRKLRRLGWSPRGLRRRFDLPSEEHVYAELGETSPRKLAA